MKKFIGELVVLSEAVNVCPKCKKTTIKCTIQVPVSKYTPFDIHTRVKDIIVDSLHCRHCNQYYLLQNIYETIKDKHLDNDKSIRLTKTTSAPENSTSSKRTIKPIYNHKLQNNMKNYTNSRGELFYYITDDDVALAEKHKRLVIREERRTRNDIVYYDGHINLCYSNHKPLYFGNIVRGRKHDHNAVMYDKNGKLIHKGRFVNGNAEKPHNHCWKCKSPIYEYMESCDDCCGYHCEKCGECLCEFPLLKYYW